MKNLYNVLKITLISITIGLTTMQSVQARPIQIPLGIAFGVEPNVMILLDNSGSMSSNKLDDGTGTGTIVSRLQVAKNALSQVLNDTDNVRFCMSRFQAAVRGTPIDSPGGFMDNSMQCTGLRSEIDNLVTTINALADPPAPTSTPLSETYYDITRYFRGQPPYFGRFEDTNGNPTTFDSPIQYRCQANSVIVVTDGDSQLDWDRQSIGSAIDFSNAVNFPDENAGGKSLPNWDNIPPDGTHHVRTNGQFPQFSDGLCGTDVTVDGSNCGNSTNVFNTSRTVFLDDLALFANETDMRNSGDTPGEQSSSGAGWDDSHFDDQVLKTHTISFGFAAGTAPIMLSDTALYGQGSAFDATTAGGLVDALKSAILTSAGGAGTGAGASQAAFTLNENGTVGIYISEFDSTRWSGELTKINLTETVSNGSVSFHADFVWSAADHLRDVQSASQRNIFTYDPIADSTVNFEFSELPNSMLFDAASQPIFGDTVTPVIGTKSLAELKIEYLRGEQDYELTATDPAERLFRTRESPLGDMVNSRPQFVKSFNFGYIDGTYADYLEEIQNRNAMIYIGANDGMLHAFEDVPNGSDIDNTSVTERFAFIPNTLLEATPALADDAFDANHQFYVDGLMSVVDAKLVSADSATGWATVLGSPLGRGFKGLFLLDVSDPEVSNTNDLFKWEINETTLNPVNGTDTLVFSKMGHMFNPPKIARFQIPDSSSAGFHDKWVMLAGNGIHSEDDDDLYIDPNDPGATPISVIGKASVLVIDLDSGELISEILLDNGYVDQDDSIAGEPAYDRLADGNGITTIEAVDINNNTYVDRLYAADLKGNLWRINYDNSQSSAASDAEYIKNNLTVAFTENNNPAPIFTAEGPVRSSPIDSNPSGSIAQAITTELTVTRAPEEFPDPQTVMILFGTGQYFDLPHVLDTENLKVQSMYAIVDQGNRGGNTRIDRTADLVEQLVNETTLTREVDPNTPPVDYDGGKLGWYLDLPTYGERILIKSVALFDFISFSSQIPRNADVCAVGTDGWVMFGTRDDAVPPEDDSGNRIILGTKVVDQAINSPIYIESSTGEIVSPSFNLDNSPINVNVTTSTVATKRYSRAAWLRVQ